MNLCSFIKCLRFFLPRGIEYPINYITTYYVIYVVLFCLACFVLWGGGVYASALFCVYACTCASACVSSFCVDVW